MSLQWLSEDIEILFQRQKKTSDPKRDFPTKVKTENAGLQV